MAQPTIELNDAQRALLKALLPKKGIAFLRGDDAAVARGMADTPFVALGPDEPGGAIAVMITDEGRAAAA